MVVDGSSYTNDDELLPDPFAATDKFTAVGRWLRRADRRLPLWWAEYYVEPADGNDDRDGWSERHRIAVQAAAMIAMAEGGATTGFYWNPENERAPTARAACGRRPNSPTAAAKLPMYGPGRPLRAGVPAGHAVPDRSRSPPTT